MCQVLRAKKMGDSAQKREIPGILSTSTTCANSSVEPLEQPRRRRSSWSGRLSCTKCCGNIWSYFLRLRVTPEELEQRYKSREIDKLLDKDRRSHRKQVKLLLLGAGESGKSTFLKQMRIIHGVWFEPELMREYQHVIYQNIVKGMQVLVDAREKLGIEWEHPTNELAANQVKFFNATLGAMEAEEFVEQAPIIHVLWKDRAIREAFDRRREFQLSDSVSYFLNELDRIARFDYVPSNQDILHCRKATKGVYEFTIRIQNIPFVFVDVGGQRTQRQKWTKCFDCSVTSILFLVSTSEFDQVLAEDKRTNRLEESRNIFDTIVNNTTFQNISIILFLNKTDLLAVKVKSPSTNIQHYFPQFSGDPRSVYDVQNFILEMFVSAKKNLERTAAIYHHFTNAVDTHNIKVVFSSVKDTILQRNLASVMLQ